MMEPEPQIVPESSAFCSTKCQVPCNPCFTLGDEDLSDPQLGDLEPEMNVKAKIQSKAAIEVTSSAAPITEEEIIPKTIEEFTAGDRVVAFVVTESVWKSGTIMKMNDQNSPEILIDGWTKAYPFEIFKALPYEPGTYVTNDWVTTRNGMDISTSERIGRIEMNQKVELIEIAYDEKHQRFRGKTAEDTWVTIKNTQDGTRFLKYDVPEPQDWCEWFLYWYVVWATTFILGYTAWNLYQVFTSPYGFYCYDFWLCWCGQEIAFWVEYGFWHVKHWLGYF